MINKKIHIICMVDKKNNLYTSYDNKSFYKMDLKWFKSLTLGVTTLSNLHYARSVTHDKPMTYNELFHNTNINYPVKSNIIMGGKTWISIGKKPLEGRNNFIISKSLKKECSNKNVIFFETIDSCIKATNRNSYKSYLIGGANLINQFVKAKYLKFVGRIYLTRADALFTNGIKITDYINHHRQVNYLIKDKICNTNITVEDIALDKKKILRRINKKIKIINNK